MKAEMKIVNIKIFYCEECKAIKEFDYQDEFGHSTNDDYEFLYEDIKIETEKEENFDYCEQCENWFCKKCNSENEEAGKMMIKEKDMAFCSQDCFEEWEN